MSGVYPAWLDREEYPFRSHYCDLPAGRMHYVDEGQGDPIVFVHGNPGWSYEYRNVIKELSETNRCIAPDHIGFGLSDKPREWNYLPESHAENFRRFIEQLELERFVLVVNDWGGPIALSYALDHPERIRHAVITNTWMWSVRKDPYYRLFSGFAGGPLGRFLTRHFNFFGRVIARQVMANTKAFDPAIYRHLQSAEERRGCWTLPRQIIASGEWLDSLWQKREALNGIPTSFIWGMKDIAFREKELNTWSSGISTHRVVRLEQVGHYPHEEATERFVAELRRITG
jgi:haloalkane dehalogenase